MAWSPDGRRLASGGADETVRIWDAGDGRPLRVLTGHSGAVSGLAWSPDGRRLASASHDQTVRVWELDGAGGPRILEGHVGRVMAVAWSPDGRRIASSGEDGTVRIWDPDSSPDPRHLRDPAGAIVSLSWSPDGRRIAASSWDRAVRIWDAEGGDPIRNIDCGPGGGHCVAWSPDGSRLLSNRDGGHVTVWDAADGRLVLDSRCKGQIGHVAGLEPGWPPTRRRRLGHGRPDLGCGRLAGPAGAAGPHQHGPCGGLVSRRLPPGVGRRGRQGPHLGSRDGAIGPVAGGPYCAVAGGRMESGRPPARLGRRGYGHPDLGPRDRRRPGRPAGSYRLRPVDLLERRWFAAGVRRRDRVVRLWDTRACEVVALRGHAGQINGVAWDPDGRRLASAGEDGVVVIRDATPDTSPIGRTGSWPVPGPRPGIGYGRRCWRAAATGTPRRSSSGWLSPEGAKETARCSRPAGGRPGRSTTPGPSRDPRAGRTCTRGRRPGNRSRRWTTAGSSWAATCRRDTPGRPTPVSGSGPPTAAPVRLRIGASGGSGPGSTAARSWRDPGRRGLRARGGDGRFARRMELAGLPRRGRRRSACIAGLDRGRGRPRPRPDRPPAAPDRWSEARAAIEEQARSRPGTAAGLQDRAIRAARTRASWLRGRAMLSSAVRSGRRRSRP